MAYVNMTKDFSEVKKTISGLGLTRRQLLAFFVGGCAGLPVFFALKEFTNLDITLDVAGLAAVAVPVMLCVLYRKDGMYIEKHLKYYYETHFVRNTERPYITNNLYSLMLQEEQFIKEVENIVFRGKTPAQIRAARAAGETSEVRIGKRKIIIPVKGPIDRAAKKELERAVKKAKLKGEIPESAQDTIPYKVPYPDGIFESDDGYFTQTIAFEDITYQLLDNEPKNMLFERWCALINYFEPEIHFQFNYGNMEIDREEYSRDFVIRPKEDSFNVVRKEYSDMLVDQFAKGTNNLKKERYLTYGIKATDYKTAKLKLGKISKQIEKNLRKLNSKAHILDGYERLHLLFRIFHPASREKFIWNFDMEKIYEKSEAETSPVSEGQHNKASVQKTEVQKNVPERDASETEAREKKYKKPSYKADKKRINLIIDISKNVKAQQSHAYGQALARSNINTLIKTMNFLTSNNIQTAEEFNNYYSSISAENEFLRKDVKQYETNLIGLSEKIKFTQDYKKYHNLYYAVMRAGEKAKFYVEHQNEITAFKASCIYFKKSGENPDAVNLKNLFEEYRLMKEDRFITDMALKNSRKRLKELDVIKKNVEDALGIELMEKEENCPKEKAEKDRKKNDIEI